VVACGLSWRFGHFSFSAQMTFWWGRKSAGVGSPSAGATRCGVIEAPTAQTIVPEGCRAEWGGREWELCCASAYLSLIAQSVAAVNPDVLGETLAPLVEFHVLRELLCG
jgi:hypothetical protein